MRRRLRSVIRWRWFACTAWGVAFVFEVAAAAVSALRGHWWIVALDASVAGMDAAFFTYNYRKVRAHGSDRRAEASPQDPGALAAGGTVNFTISADPSAALTTLRTLATSPSLTGYYQSLTDRHEARKPIETVESEMPILAHRIARLRFDGTPRHFKPLHKGHPFGVDADASCQTDPYFIRYAALGRSGYDPSGHEAPALGCTCGFYALPSDIEPWDENADYVTLMVELSGTVIEHEKRYRAQHQRVVECQVPACRYCGREADWLLCKDGQMESAACTAHLPPRTPEGYVVVGVSDLDLGVPITRRGRAA